MAMQALVFDYDGVLVETETNAFQLLTQILKDRHQIVLSSDLFQKKVGRATNQFLIDHLTNHLSSDQIEAVYTEYTHQFQKRIFELSIVHHPIINLIRQASKTHQIGIASMGLYQRIDTMIQSLGISEDVDAIITREDVTHHKPHPEVYLTCLQQLQVPASQALAIEDSAVGAQAAIAAGITTLGLINEVNSEADFAGLPITATAKLTEVESLVMKMLSA